MKKLLPVLFLLFAANCFGQNRNSVWCFGDSAGIDFSNLSNPVPFTSGMRAKGTCVSVADSSGNLLFYANIYNPIARTLIWDASNDTLDNADSLFSCLGLYNEMQIVPMPGNPSEYYLFYIGVGGAVNGLYYAIIDMTLNNGLGSVIIKNQTINTNRIADCITAVKHGNGRDWWLITKLSSGNFTTINRFIVYLITPQGISSAIHYDFGNATDLDFQKLVFNSNNSKIMNINLRGYMCEYDFDRCNGLISSPHLYLNEQGPVFYNRYLWEGAYSPNDSLFYSSTTWVSASQSDTSRLLQFNLADTNILITCDTLGYWTRPIHTGAVRLAPNNKIYISNNYATGFVNFPYPDSVYNYINMNLSVINEPNNIGSACNFQPFSYYLGGKRTYAGLPSNPDYNLGALLGSPCDTITTIPHIQPTQATSQLMLTYITSWQTLFVNAQNLKSKNCLLQVFDVSGKLIYSTTHNTVNGYFTCNVALQTMAKGVYVVKLVGDEEVLGKRFVRE